MIEGLIIIGITFIGGLTSGLAIRARQLRKTRAGLVAAHGRIDALHADRLAGWPRMKEEIIEAMEELAAKNTTTKGAE